MDRTPKEKSSLGTTTPGFSPLCVHESPGLTGKNLTGHPRLIKDLAADIYNSIQQWNGILIQGAPIVKQAMELKITNRKKYIPELEEMMVALYNLIEKLQCIVKKFGTYADQMKALEKLSKSDGPIFISMTMTQLSALVHEIVAAYKLEIEEKEKVVEHIPYARNEEEAILYYCLWVYEINITNNIRGKVEALLTDTGHRQIK